MLAPLCNTTFAEVPQLSPEAAQKLHCILPSSVNVSRTDTRVTRLIVAAPSSGIIGSVNGRRLRGVLLGIIAVSLNILLVATLVVVMSHGSLSGAFFGGDDDFATTQTPTPAPVTSTPEAPDSAEADPSEVLRERFGNGEPLDVVVLGDQTGTHEDEWVQAWARSLAEVRPVELLSPTAVDPTTYADPILLGTERPGPGNGLITLRNASLVGASPAYVTPRLALLVPRDTDVVILSFGRSNSPEDIVSEMSELHMALSETVADAKVRVTVQPPRQDGAPAMDELVRRWAAEAGLDTIDVAAEFAQKGLVGETVSTRDPLSVNVLGGRTWAEIVHEALFGPVDSASLS